MSAFPALSPPVLTDQRPRLLAVAAALLLVLLGAAALRHAGGGRAGIAPHDPWLALHLLTVLPAIPLGIVIMLNRKGDRLHRRLGRIWGALMLGAAASSFGLGLHWGPIHLLSLLTLVAVPAGIASAMRGNIRAHRRTMTILFASLVVAGFFTLLPGRLLGSWLFGAV